MASAAPLPTPSRERLSSPWGDGAREVWLTLEPQTSCLKSRSCIVCTRISCEEQRERRGSTQKNKGHHVLSAQSTPGTLLHVLSTLSHLSLQQPYKGGPVIFPFLLMSRLGTDRINVQDSTDSINRARSEVCMTPKATLYFSMFLWVLFICFYFLQLCMK